MEKINKIKQEGERKIKELVKSVLKNHPQTILTEEMHEENISRMLFLLNLYLNGNSKIQIEVENILQRWKNN